ncbi:MAG: arginase family protein [Candidatus Sungbacteria bacterium]|nr:arginase family protein [Candidatus Sungbacteria bacterium]
MRVLKVPYDRGGGIKSYGASFGPEAIEQQFRKFLWRCSEDGVSLPAVQFVDMMKRDGSPTNLKGVFAREVDAVLERNEFGLTVLSGDNSCSFFTVEGVASIFPSPHLVVLDAHPDLCNFYHHPHASWVRGLWEKKIVIPSKTFFFGIRDAEEVEMAYLKEKGAVVFSCDELSGIELSNVFFDLKTRNKINTASALILVVDIDVVDPSQAPGTGVLRAPGLDLRKVLRTVREFGRLPFPFKVGEITEVIPKAGNAMRPEHDKRDDPSNLTVLAAEAILREMIYQFSKNPA